MEIDSGKAILFLLGEAFLNAHDKKGKNFNQWCKEKNVVKLDNNQLSCQDCKYVKEESYHDQMWCRDCQQYNHFKTK